MHSDFSPLSDIWFVTIFSCSVGYLFILLTVSFDSQKFLRFLWSHLSIFAFVTSASYVISKKSLQVQCHKASPSCFLLGFLLFWIIHLGLNPFWVNFCTWCKVRVQLYSFPCWYPIFPTILAKETVFSPLSSIGILAKDHLTIYSRVYFWGCISFCGSLKRHIGLNPKPTQTQGRKYRSHLSMGEGSES